MWLMLVEPPVAQSTLLRPGGFGLVWMTSIGAVMFLFMLAAATLALPRRRLAAGGAGLMLALVLAGMLAGRLGTRAALLAAGGGPGRLDAPLAAPAHYPWITFAALGLALGLTRLAQRMVFSAPGRG
ncbi:MAG: hypothetical protein BWZ08_02417 [candidate division BRC1 bacterium ADurb.BinA292]|nr:MAG: hypothetical protein BWZ08_02417 [candidate division BRC1 bacterium ADurb.BinA292]